MMKTKLIVLIAAIALIALPALADLKAYPNSGGMNLPTFIDSKAEPVIGVGTSPDGKSKAELGGIYTLGPGEKPPLYDFTEHGSVILDISKVGDQIVVKWKVNTDPVTGFPELAGQLIDVYCMTGDGTGSYFPLYFPTIWKKVVKVENNIETQVDPHPINIAPAGYQVAIFPKKEIEDWHGEIRVPKQVGLAEGQKEIYFKAKLSDPLLEGMDAFPKVATVGKVDVSLLAGGLGYNYISIPLDNGDNAINNVFPVNSLDEGTLVFTQMEGFDFNIAKLQAAKWVSAFNTAKDVGATFFIKPELGYMVRVPANKLVTCVGRVLQGTKGDSVTVKTGSIPKDYNYFGNYYPIKFQLSSPTVNQALKLNDAVEGDRIFYAEDLNFNFNIAKYKNGKWVSEFNQAQDSNIVLKIPKGYMYKRKGGEFIWIR